MVTHHAAGQPTRHQGKPNEQKQPRSPHGARVSKAFFTPDAVFIDHVDDEESEQGADSWDPVDESYVDGRCGVFTSPGSMSVRGEDCGIEKDPLGECKLSKNV